MVTIVDDLKPAIHEVHVHCSTTSNTCKLYCQCDHLGERHSEKMLLGTDCFDNLNGSHLHRLVNDTDWSV